MHRELVAAVQLCKLNRERSSKGEDAPPWIALVDALQNLEESYAGFPQQ